MSLHAIGGAMMDGTHFDDVFEVGEGALDFQEFFVDAHGLDRGQIGLFSLDDVLALVSLLAGKVDWMLEELKRPPSS